MEEEQKIESGIDGVYLFDESDKKFFDQYKKDEVVVNGLLGEYVDGEYTISDEIKKSLASGFKYITEQINEDSFKLILPSGDYKFNMLLEMHIEDREKVAILKLVEKISAYTEEFERLFITEIAEYKDFNDIYFWDKVRKVFAIYDTEADTKDFDKEKNALLASQRKALLKKQLSFVFKEEERYKEYMRLMVKFLESCGHKGEFLFKKYKALIEKNNSKFDKNSPGYYFKLKKMLDEIIMTSGIKFSPQEKVVLNDLRKENYFDDAIKKSQKVEPAKKKPAEWIKSPQNNKKSESKGGGKPNKDEKDDKNQKNKDVSDNKKINDKKDLSADNLKQKGFNYIYNNIESNIDKIESLTVFGEILPLNKPTEPIKILKTKHSENQKPKTKDPQILNI